MPLRKLSYLQSASACQKRAGVSEIRSEVCPSCDFALPKGSAVEVRQKACKVWGYCILKQDDGKLASNSDDDHTSMVIAVF